jgi:uncharacterized OB-fold protein
MNTCAQCGADNKPIAKVCEQCGADLEEVKVDFDADQGSLDSAIKMPSSPTLGAPKAPGAPGAPKAPKAPQAPQAPKAPGGPKPLS